MKKHRFNLSLVVIAAIALIVGCDATPDDRIIEEAITKSLHNAVPLHLHARPDVCRAVSIDEIKVLETGEQRTLQTPGDPIPYWPVTVFVKGDCLPVFHKEGDTLAFEGEATMYLFKDPRSKTWVAEKDKP